MTKSSLAVCVWLALTAVLAGQGTGPVDYSLGPDSQPQAGVPKGKLSQHTLAPGRFYPGTPHNYQIYVPAQYDAARPAPFMIFLDGNGYAGEAIRVPVVFDNLIHAGQMPVTVGIFINPGIFEPAETSAQPRRNRSFEYDTLSDQYARFLIEEMLPEVGRSYKLTDDLDRRAVCGISSGGICAFTVAWARPDAFRKVLSHVGSFTNIRGGHVYPQLVKDSPKKPIRIHMQDGTNDNRRPENPLRDWYLQNKLMHEALKEKGYDVKYVLGDGPHNSQHGGAILPDSLRWLWRSGEAE